MAHRIHNSVVRGEIDNRVRGAIRGRIWLEGLAEPLILKLSGNAHPDLAGCLLTFQNTKPRLYDPQNDSLSQLQHGAAGDLTASRKVKSLGSSEHEMSNAIYLEWFSETDGRVVIESMDYQIAISPPEWQLTPEEEGQRARDVDRAIAEFIANLTRAIEEHTRDQKDPEAPWDEHDYERLLRESDARTDKYGELLERYGDSPEAEEQIAEAMGWNEEPSETEAENIEEINRACEEALREPWPEPEPHREGIDWIRTDKGDLRHPLQHRCFESAMKFHQEIEECGLEDTEDPAVDDFVFELQTAAAKLAGALGSIARGDYPANPAFTVACLKRALSHLHKSQAGLETLRRPDLLPDDFVPAARQELFAVREGILRLMEQLRGKD